MEYRWLGSSGIKVSSLALGAMGFGGSTTGGWVGNHELDDVRRHVGMALDAGVILFDSANSYQKGTAEELLGKALGADRDRVLVSTKVNSRMGDGINDVGQSRWHILRSCEDSLRRLGTDRIDIYHVHGFDACTPLEESLGALDALVQSGKVRYIACSNHAAWQIMKALSVADRRGLSALCRDAELLHAGRPRARVGDHAAVRVTRVSACSSGARSPAASCRASSPRDADPPAGTRRAMIGNLGIGPIDEERRLRHRRRHALTSRSNEVVASPCAQVALNWLRTRDLVSLDHHRRPVRRTARRQPGGHAAWTMTADEQQLLDEVSAVPLPYPHWYQRQFTAERYSRRRCHAGRGI